MAYASSLIIDRAHRVVGRWMALYNTDGPIYTVEELDVGQRMDYSVMKLLRDYHERGRP